MEGLRNFGSKNKDHEIKEITTTTSNSELTETKTQVLVSDGNARSTTISDKVALSPSPSVTPTANSLVTSATSVSTSRTATRLANGSGLPGAKNASTTAVPARVGSGPADPLIDPQRGEGRQEVIEDNERPKIHWTRYPEHFPIPSESLTPLPTARPRPIPKIQHDFPEESAEDKVDRQEKLQQIKKTFEFSWDGYVKNAWMQDELLPVSGQYRNPFCGWAATLVDSLDTLWMMGMIDQFENATTAVKNIDFTTSPRKDIPMFETTIRYLGGLLGAFDISGGKHMILLDKAVELAEILMGAFDTPNRMPMTFYYWQPAFASQPHRARTRVVLAELGSMSVEFTRLAQITKEDKYYDAIARITNEFEIWQNNTKIPGLWPKSVDASGCKKPSLLSTPVDKSLTNGPGNPKVQSPQLVGSHDLEDGEWVWQGKQINKTSIMRKIASKDSPEITKAPKEQGASNSEDMNNPLADSPAWLTAKSKGHSHEEPAGPSGATDDTSKASSKTSDAIAHLDHSADKRQLEDEVPSSTSESPKQADCEPQGFASPPNIYNEDFTIGGQADSVYEYLPKEYMLLGGLEEKYRTMYEATLAPIEKHLLFRPMIPDEKRDILFAGLLITTGNMDKPEETHLKPENTHLTCFAGGMYAIGAKIFRRDGDLDIAKKLTDGCVWSYEATATGIMPEVFLGIPCDSTKTCPWNVTKWYDALAPRGSKQYRVDDAPAKATQVTLDDKPNVPDPKSETEVHQAKSLADKTNKLQQEEKSTASTSATTKRSVGVVVESTPVSESLKKRQFDLEAETEKLMDSKVAKVDKSLNSLAATSSNRIPSKTEADPAVINPKGNGNVGKLATEEAITKADVTATNEDPSVRPVEPEVPEYTPPAIPTQEEYAKSRISDERLPEGMIKIWNSKYILR